ncbi:hypothetical protein GCM10010320_71760 [Streptomyces caelestis]|nr:hypothetical protein GCM10010320_71760 [Streptomyces caelestis]
MSDLHPGEQQRAQSGEPRQADRDQTDPLHPVPALGPRRRRPAMVSTPADVMAMSDTAKPIGAQFPSHLHIASRRPSVSNSRCSNWTTTKFCPLIQTKRPSCAVS